jgi:MoxR-like ATPase
VDAHAATQASSTISAQLIAEARAAVDRIHVAPELAGYVVDVAAASRSHPHVALGLSTRGVLALLRAARIAAGMRGAEFVAPDDVKDVAPLVIPHRLVLASDAVLEGVTEQDVTARLLEQTPGPK